MNDRSCPLSDRLRSDSAAVAAGAATDSFSQRRNELLLELERKTCSEHHPSSGETASGWNGAVAQAGVGASADVRT